MTRQSFAVRTFLFWSCAIGAILISAAYFAHRFPIAVGLSNEPEKSAEFVVHDDSAQVCLVIDTIVLRNSFRDQKLSLADFSVQWDNILAQEVGRFDVINVDRLSVDALRGRSLVVLSGSTRNSLTNGQALALRAFVSRGGSLVLDYPDDSLLMQLGLHMRANNANDGRTSWRFSGAAVPVYSKRVSFKVADSSLTPLLVWRDSMFCAEQLGNGHIIATSCDMARAITLIQQGRPEEDFAVVNRYADHGASNKLEANDLICDSLFLDCAIPYADILERELFHFISTLTVLPRWDMAPPGADGIFLMTHDDEGLGDAGAWMNRYESAHGYRSTTFMMQSEKLSAAGIAETRANGGELGLHWNRFDRPDKGAFERRGIGPWRPLVRRRNLASQWQWLDSLGAPTTANRNHYFLWDSSYTATFRKLAHMGMTMESSYGPDLASKGFIFGTACPFRPIDSSGALFTMWEVPVAWTENFAGADSGWVEGIFARNAKNVRGAICALYHNNTFAWQPSYDIYESWQGAYQSAQAWNQQLMTIGELERFLDARTRANLRWRQESEGVALDIGPLVAPLALIIAQAGSPERPLPLTAEMQVDSIAIGGISYWRINTPAGISRARLPNGRLGGE